MSTAENNKLIVGLLDLELNIDEEYVFIDQYGNDIHFTLDNAMFDTSWDWLTPGIKALNLDVEEYEHDVHSIEDAMWDNDISEAYAIVVRVLTERQED